ncbi:MAG: hypothetical protein LQ337_006718 [Flavoplaca oasis]|nr:MAG: hypothetical protein LQ337_006718 [Flavoplaca oasis]
MYPLFFLFTTTLLPLSILAAPTPVDPIVRVDSHYQITSAHVRTAVDRSAAFTNIDFELSIRGTKPGNVDINCVGGVDVKDKPESMQLNCPLDPGLVVWVTAGLDNGFDLTVQYLDEEKAFGNQNFGDANWEKTAHWSPYKFDIYVAKQGWEISSNVQG